MKRTTTTGWTTRVWTRGRRTVGVLLALALAAGLLTATGGPAAAAVPLPPAILNYDDPGLVAPVYRSAMIEFETNAVNDVIADHSLASTDDVAVRGWARDAVRAQMWVNLTAIINKPTRTANEQLVYEWFAKIVQQQYIDAADYSVLEYERYSGNSLDAAVAGVDPVAWTPEGAGYCNYRMPAPYADRYVGWKDALCLGNLPQLPGPNFLAPAVTYDDLVAVGTQRMIDAQLNPSNAVEAERVLQAQGIQMSVGAAIAMGATLAAGAVAVPIATKLTASGLEKSSVVVRLLPNLGRTFWKPTATGAARLTAEAAGKVAAKVSAVLTRTVVKLFAASVGVIVDFVITTVLTSIDLANQLDLPKKLKALRDHARSTTPDLAALAANPDSYPGLFSAFLTRTTPEATPGCVDGDIVIRTHPWDIACANAPAPAAESGSDPIWQVTPQGGATELATAITTRSPFADRFVTRASGKGWFVIEKHDPDTGELGATVQSLQFPYLDWDGNARMAERVWDPVNGYRFVSNPLDVDTATAHPCTSSCVSPTLQILDAAGRQVTARLVVRQVIATPQLSYPTTQTSGLVTTYSVTNPAAGTTYTWNFPCNYGSGTTLTCQPGCAVVDANGLCIDFAHPRATGQGSTLAFDMRPIGTQTFTVTATKAGSSLVTTTGTVVVTSPVNTIEFTQPTGMTYEPDLVAGKGVATQDLETAASSRLPVTVTPDAASTGICEVVGSTVVARHVGTCTLMATQPGDQVLPGGIINFNWLFPPATPVTRSFTITAGSLPVGITKATVQYSDPEPSGFSISTPATALTALGVTGTATGCAAPAWLTDTSGKVAQPAGAYRLGGCSGLSTPDASVVYNAFATVTAESATITATSTSPVAPLTASVRARIAQQADGSPGDLRLARVNVSLFRSTNTTTLPDAQVLDVDVAADGTVSLDVPNLAAGTYRVVAEFAPSPSYFAGPSATWNVTVASASAPTVVRQPTSVVVTPGRTVTFRVAASGLPAPTVQWSRSTDGGKTYVALPGATSATLTLRNVALTQTGQRYRATLTNGSGSVVSAAAVLGVLRAPTKVTAVTATVASSLTSVTVRWKAPTGVRVTGYDVRISAAGSSTTFGAWRTVTVTKAVFARLRARATYRIQVRAHNPAAAGPAVTVVVRLKR